MASAAAAISTLTLLRSPPPPRVPVASAAVLVTPTHAHTLPLLRRRPRSLTTAYAAADAQTSSAARTTTQQQRWTSVPVAAIAPATDDESMFLITLDVSGAQDLLDAYTTPGQYLMSRVPSSSSASETTTTTKKLSPAYMCISSAPRAGLQFDLLVKSVPGTTSEQLCNLQVGDAVEIGPVMGKGFAIQHINPAAAAETMLLFAVGEGISPMRSLIEFGFAASERADVRLYYAAKDLQSMAYQDRFNKWEKTGVKQTFLESNLDEIIVNSLSTGAVIVAPQSTQEVITGVLLDLGVAHDKILSIEWSPKDPFASNV